MKNRNANKGHTPDLFEEVADTTKGARKHGATSKPQKKVTKSKVKQPILVSGRRASFGLYFTDFELAEKFGVSRQTIWRWVKQGTFPAPVKLAKGTSRWRQRDVEAFEKKVAKIQVVEKTNPARGALNE
ncbi:helix-turn-helix transcriptional regulator [Parasedimentitalea huanghaiensis]|uniref:Helix-turn-helix domain-containing protein n=1 Tax=Parasedimentitalea huanghaiensis TaxID=2682100 RepID=A0A6L6WP84_9RHOB|nr:helix-turn-helix domain-containing protein [Zongyanglinia huanghaiensis]MVO18485.1 helix-turn-helix domain-containing protein [Zongyanglinia huanghaiensis]